MIQGFRALGFRVWGFRSLGFRALGFRVRALGFRGFRRLYLARSKISTGSAIWGYNPTYNFP